MRSLARWFAVLLLFVHAGLGVWAAVGFAELSLAEVPWPRISNPELSRPLLLVHWTLIGAAAVVFLGGYLRRWPRTPIAMLAIYAAMALVCAYQTLFVLSNESRFVAMAIEYAEYTIISLFLWRSELMRERFSSSAC
ncbi:MAG TPA: hypothetical protein VK034_29025 [Enhygromyxa sp.]|nr:hypothetical protein [Enhygromyxa sp.]